MGLAVYTWEKGTVIAIPCVSISAGPTINCINTHVVEGGSIVLLCEASDPPNATVIFILRGRERACDNCTLEPSPGGGSFWEVCGNASSCRLTVSNAQSSDGGEYVCEAQPIGSKASVYVEVIPVSLLLETVLSSGFLVLVVSVLVISLSTFVCELCRKRKRKERTSDPPGKISQSSFLISKY